MKRTLLIVSTLLIGLVSASRVAAQPHIVVLHPAIHAHVHHTFVLSGDANVFEGVVSYKLLKSTGAVVKHGQTQATCGTGCMGHFHVSVHVSMSVPHGYYKLKVFEVSQNNGSMLHVVTVPLYLTTS